MPFTLFTIIQADDDALGPAADYLENTFRHNRQRSRDMMARASRQSSSEPLVPEQTTNVKDDVLQSESPIASATIPTRQENASRLLRPENGMMGYNAQRVPISHARNRSPRARTRVPARVSSASPVQSTSMTSAPSRRPLSMSSAEFALRSPPRAQSPFRPSPEDANTSGNSPAPCDGRFEVIAEDSELELPGRTLQPSLYNKFRGSAGRPRRPVSPLHSSTSTLSSTPLSSCASSPALSNMRYNESFPTLHSFASTSSISSISSTPTSMRSRSPSISSLDTIEDVPDLESLAIEADKRAQADADHQATTRPRTASLDIPRSGATMGFGKGTRKRWSVCGGERRADLDLETIYED